MSKKNNEKKNLKLQKSLIRQALSPIALFTFVKVFTIHFPFYLFIKNILAYIKKTDLSFKLTRTNLFFDILKINEESDLYSDVILLFCFVWFIVSIVSYFSFSSKSKYGYDINNIKIENISIEEESNLNFFISFLLPLVANELFTLNNFCFFLLTLILLKQLLLRTKFFYVNPMLSILKYTVLHFTFDKTDPKAVEGNMIGITKQKISEVTTLVCAKKIVNNIYYIYVNGEENDKK